MAGSIPPCQKIKISIFILAMDGNAARGFLLFARPSRKHLHTRLIREIPKVLEVTVIACVSCSQFVELSKVNGRAKCLLNQRTTSLPNK